LILRFLADQPDMIARPPDLPDFGSPPVTEVVLGVQFGSLERFMAPHLGLVWTEFREQFPIVEEHPPLEPVFETFSDKAPDTPMPRLHLELLMTPPTPRVFLVNAARTELLQVQRDRFLHNWRKVGEGDAYPRFERMLETFESGYRRFEALIGRQELGAIVPNQCEVSYINQIELPPDQGPFEAFERLFGSFAKSLILQDLGRPEDARFLMRYVIRTGGDAPSGRLLVTATPAWKADGTHLIQLTLVARGKPASADLGGVSEFLKLGRRHIVRAFTELTSDEMHRVWDRKQ
jgi:uncharacterized protein (TIGR04255 family)